MRDRRLWRLVGIACALRVAYVLLYPQQPVAGDAIAYDQEGYHLAFSHGVLQGNEGPVHLSKGPVYPLFLAGIYRVAGHSHAAVRVAQAVISALSVALIFLLARMVLGRTAATTAGLLAALCPPFMSYAGLLLTETLSVFLLAAYVAAAAQGIRTMRLGWWAAAGALAGVLILHRQETLLVLAATGIAAWRWRTGRRRLGLLLGMAALVMLPWVARNYAVYRQWVLVNPQQGAAVWLSANWEEWHAQDPAYRALIDGQGLNAVEQDRRLLQAGLRSIVEHPGRYAALCLQRIPQMWVGGHSHTVAGLEDSLGAYWDRGAWAKVAAKALMFGVNMLIIALGVLGMGIAWRRGPAPPHGAGLADRRLLALLVIPVAVTAVVHVALFATIRYQVPMMPFMTLFAAVPLGMLREAARGWAPAAAIRTTG